MKITLKEASEKFQEKADNFMLDSYDRAEKNIQKCKKRLELLREKLKNVPNKEAYWDIKGTMEPIKDEYFYWMGEKRDAITNELIGTIKDLQNSMKELASTFRDEMYNLIGAGIKHERSRHN